MLIRWFLTGSVIGMTTLSIAIAVPSRVTDDRKLYESLSEVDINKERDFTFDQDIRKLSAIEGRYREGLPLRSKSKSSKKEARNSKSKRKGKKTRTVSLVDHDRLSAPVGRIEKMPYRYSGKI